MNVWKIVDPLKEYEESEMIGAKIIAMGRRLEEKHLLKSFCKYIILTIYKKQLGFRRYFLLDWWKLKIGL